MAITRRTDPQTLLSGEPEFALADPEKLKKPAPVKDPLRATRSLEDDDEDQGQAQEAEGADTQEDAGEQGIELPEKTAEEPTVPAALRGLMSIAKKSSEEQIGASPGEIPEADEAPELAAPPSRTRSQAKAAAPVAGDDEAEAQTAANAAGEDTMAARPKMPDISEIPWRRGPRAEDAWKMPQINAKTGKWECIPVSPKTPGSYKPGDAPAKASSKAKAAPAAAAAAPAKRKPGRPKAAAPTAAAGNGHALTNIEQLQAFQTQKAEIAKEVEDFKAAKDEEIKGIDAEIEKVKAGALEDLKKQQEAIAATMKALGV